jgi:hypothetical protein
MFGKNLRKHRELRLDVRDMYMLCEPLDRIQKFLRAKLATTLVALMLIENMVVC